MAQIMQELFSSFGIDYIPTTFADFFPWFFGICFAVGILMFVLDALFFVARSTAKGVR